MLLSAPMSVFGDSYVIRTYMYVYVCTHVHMHNYLLYVLYMYVYIYVCLHAMCNQTCDSFLSLSCYLESEPENANK